MSVRKGCCGVLDLLVERWSPRAMSGESLEEDQLRALFEAARWAPSSYNNQPWRFIYTTRTMPEWEDFLDLLVPANKEWARQGAVLIVVISHKYFEYNGNYSRTHSFDTGAATQNLALQGFFMNLVVHGMEGFDYDRARALLEIPESYDIEALFVVGKPGSVDSLPERFKQKETPSDRHALERIVCKGKWDFQE